MKPLIYISGPITGRANFQKRFKECEDYINYETEYIAINPATQAPYMLNKLGMAGIATYNNYMKVDLTLLMDKNCNDIIYLTGWHRSKGANIERMYARFFNYKEHLYFHTEKNNKRMVSL